MKPAESPWVIRSSNHGESRFVFANSGKAPKFFRLWERPCHAWIGRESLSFVPIQLLRGLENGGISRVRLVSEFSIVFG